MSVKSSIQDFQKLGGNHILFANVASKLLSFASSVAAIRLLTAEGYGAITYGLSIFLFLRPFMGGGAHFGILRFGPLQESTSAKKSLYKYSLGKGSLFNVILVILLLVIIQLPIFKIEESRIYTLVLGSQLFTLFPFELIKSHYRVLMKNRTYAYVDVIFYGFQLLLIFSLTPFFNEWGYILAICASPLITFIIYSLLLSSSKNESPNIQKTENKGLWNYSIKVSFSSSASQLLFILDFFLIGLLLTNPTQLAGYRSATIIPLSLLFIPTAYITTYYVSISSNFEDRSFLNKFIANYWKIIIPLTVLITMSLWFFSSSLLELFFGKEYKGFYHVFRILAIGMAGAFIFRIPFGNLLMGVGKAGKNLLVSLTTLALNLILNLLLVPKYGIIGAAWATSVSLWFSGLIALFLFIIYLKTLHYDRSTDYQ